MFSLLVAMQMALVAITPGYSQETIAGGSLGTEAAWTSLKNIADKAAGDARTAQILANAIRNCGLKGRVYGPGTNGVDAEGCKEGANSNIGSLQNQINNLSNQVNYLQNRPNSAPSCSVGTDFGQCVISQGANASVQGNYKQCPDGFAFVAGSNYSSGAGGQWHNFTCCRMVVRCN